MHRALVNLVKEDRLYKEYKQKKKESIPEDEGQPLLKWKIKLEEEKKATKQARLYYWGDSDLFENDLSDSSHHSLEEIKKEEFDISRDPCDDNSVKDLNSMIIESQKDDQVIF